MDRIRNGEEGLAILETSAVMLILLGILLSGWAALDLFQRGLSLGELIEGIYYDGVVNAYTISENGQSIEVNQEGLTRFVRTKIGLLADEIESQGVSSSSYALQGALVEVEWRPDSEPRVARVTVVDGEGGLSVPSSLRQSFDIHALSQAYLAKLVREGSSRQSMLRPDVWHGGVGQESYISDRFILLGTSAALSVEDGLARLLLDGAGRDPVLVRSSFNTLRRDL